MQTIKARFKKARSTSKGRLILSIFLLVIIITITGGVVYWQTNKNKLIREKIESAIEEKSGGFYTIHYESLDLDEITGYLSITNLRLGYDTNKYKAMKELHLDPPTLFTIQIPEIIVEGVKTPKALIDKEIDGRKLTIRNPMVEIIYTGRGKDSLRKVPGREIYQQILGNLHQISIDSVSISGATIITRNQKTKQTGIELKNANLALIDVKIDSVANADTTRLFYSKKQSIAFESLSWLSDDKRYKFHAKNVSSNSTAQDVHIDEFVLDPLKGEQEFVNSLRTQDDRFDFRFNDIVLRNVDYFSLLNEKVNADSLVVRSATFKIYRDLNIPRDKKNRVGDYPHQAFQRLPVDIDVRKVVLANAFIEYKERNNITKKSGKVQMYDVYATISNFTNKKESIRKNNIMTLVSSCKFLNKTPFNVNWQFFLGDQNGKFNIKANMGSIDAKDLNALTEPMGPARIQKGEIKGFSFELKGSDHTIDGTMTLLYDNLKIAVLEKDKGAKEWDKKSLTSLFANILIKNSNLPKNDKPAQTITVNYPRDENRSIFNFAWKALFKGIMETVSKV
jgi:hypothetical protein